MDKLCHPASTHHQSKAANPWQQSNKAAREQGSKAGKAGKAGKAANSAKAGKATRQQASKAAHPWIENLSFRGRGHLAPMVGIPWSAENPKMEPNVTKI